MEKYLFIDKYYDLIDKTHDFQTNKQKFVESSLKPDFTFRDKKTKKEFFVEAKFRSWVIDDKVEWTYPNQLSRYQQFNNQKPVFLILGLGDNPSRPEAVSLVPLSKAKWTALYLSVIEKFEIDPDRPVNSTTLWKFL